MPIYKMEGSKNGKQKYRVRVNYVDALGKYRQVERIVYGSVEAKDLERALMVQIKEETPAKRMTLRELYDEYIRYKKHEVRESSLNKSKSILENHVLSSLGSTPLGKIRKPLLAKWKSEIDERVVKSSDGSSKYIGITTKQNIYGEFRALLNYGVKMDYIPHNYLKDLGNFKSTFEPKKEMSYYTSDEFKKYIAAAKEYAENCSNCVGWDYYVFFNIAFYTGLRKGEIHALKWSDIDGEYLSVKRSISQKQRGEDRETAPKNKSSVRTLQIPLPLLEILQEHKSRWEKLDGFTDDYRICGGTHPLRDSTLSKMNAKFAKTAGVKQIRIHDFRHSHATLLANEGINIQEIARRLGHSDVTMTWNTYSHLYPREEERAVKILNKIG